MVTKMKPPSPATVIKWTEEEWELIAKQLYTTMGSTLLNSDTLDEVKAKDVFVAQEAALPEHRHRKLISISQSFQSVREKLKGIFAKAAAAMRQNDLFATEPQKVAAKSRKQPKPVASEAVSSHSSIAEEPGASATSDIAAHAVREKPAITVDVSPSDESPTSPIADQGTASEIVASAVTPQPDAARGDSPQSRPLPKQPAAPQRPLHEAPAVTRSPEPGTGQTRPAQPSPMAMSGHFNDMLRPFIAMVSQEFAQALVNVVTKPENRNALSEMMRNVIGNAGAVNTRNANQGNAAHRTPAQQRSADYRNPAFVANGPASSRNSATAQDEDEDAEHDVQPLFDPKLPPSANSSDKPTVGVVGASAHDFDELQQMYPQLQLIAVAVDDVPHAATLGQCQRVIGLREDVPAHTDEQLRYTFRNRYLRLTGGMGRVREQLGAWLDKPGSTEPRRPKFNKPRHNHNNGQPDGQKKRFNNHPRKPK
jgi:hypothetical protein